MGCFFQIPFLKCLVSTSTPVPCVCNCEPKILIPSEGNPYNNILYLLKILSKNLIKHINILIKTHHSTTLW